MSNERILNGGGLTRRELLAAGAGAVAGGSLLGALSGCGGFVGPDINPIDSYVLDVAFRDLIIGGRQCRLRCYNGMIPGPTIRTAPAHRLRVKVKNALPPNKPLPGDAGGGVHVMGRATAREDVYRQNTPHRFNSTNIHYHGLQIKPHLFAPVGTTQGDAPFIEIKPGTDFSYEFAIPGDHPSGMYLYHPHYHGSTLLQVVNGMAGVIIVEGPIDRVPEIAAARDVHLAITDLGLFPSIDDPNIWTNDPTPGKYFNPQTGLPLDGYGLGAYMIQQFLVNGHPVYEYDFTTGNQVNRQLPVDRISIRPGEVVRIRIANATSDTFMPVMIEGHTMHVIGYDGINVLHPRSKPSVPGQAQAELAPFNRVECLIKGGAPGVYRVLQLEQNEQFAPVPEKVLLEIVVEGAPMDMALPTSLPTPEREYPLPTAADVTGHHSVQFSVQFPYPQLPTGVGFLLNGLLYDQYRIDHVARRGSVEEWTLINISHEGHPFHVHVNSFQVISVNNVFLDETMILDTIWLRPNQPVVIRMPFREWTGKTVYHCHILPHEDTGMMQNFTILP